MMLIALTIEPILIVYFVAFIADVELDGVHHVSIAYQSACTGEYYSEQLHHACYETEVEVRPISLKQYDDSTPVMSSHPSRIAHMRFPLDLAVL